MAKYFERLSIPLKGPWEQPLDGAFVWGNTTGLEQRPVSRTCLSEESSATKVTAAQRSATTLL